MPLLPESLPETIFKDDGTRLDGRKFNELRDLHIEVGVLKNADGSALVCHGKNRIIAGAYGPREVHPRHLAKSDTGILQISYRMATFSVGERKSPVPGRREKEISMVVGKAIEPVLFLEQYPNTTIDVFITVLTADGGTRCASVTAAACAIADMGIPMKDLVAGVAVGKIANRIILDVSDKEDKWEKGGATDMPVAVMVNQKQYSLLQLDGSITVEQFEEMLDLVFEGGKLVYEKQKEALRRKYSTEDVGR
ncbi:exosome complex exonuclease Rrp41 [Candidatus Bathyarchaeota archaeon]|nr:exosome complex exonuclease Rrp41 [Candidatus Bathyarchaeota archaeon]